MSVFAGGHTVDSELLSQKDGDGKVEGKNRGLRGSEEQATAVEEQLPVCSSLWLSVWRNVLMRTHLKPPLSNSKNPDIFLLILLICCTSAQHPGFEDTSTPAGATNSRCNKLLQNTPGLLLMNIMIKNCKKKCSFPHAFLCNDKTE